MKKSLFSLALFFLIAATLPTLAQTRFTSITVKGTVVDSTTNLPLQFATVALLSPKDSSVVTGGITTTAGTFEFAGTRPGTYKLRINFLGYKTIKQVVKINNSSRVQTFGPFQLPSNSTTLKEVTIIGQKAPVVVKTDTVEFSAVNFKTEKNDVVEEMIKKLPGVDVDKDGNIQAHGKDVTKILVDGKPFFGNDPKLATQNLPAEMIDKVQVIDQKSDQAQFTKIDDGQSEKVINIITKMGYKHGNFGKLSLGGGKSLGFGADDRFDESGMFNSFKDDRQLSIIGMSNNVNITRFTADMGASVGGNRGGGGGMRGGGGGGSNFGFGGNGINTTNALGVNFKDKIGKLDFASSYFFNSRDNNNNQYSHKETLLADSSFLTNTTTLSHSTNANHRFNAQMDYMVDSSFSIRFTPNVSFGNTSSDVSKDIRSFGKIGGFDINDGTSNVSSDATNMNASGNLLFRKQFKKPRRTLSLNLSGNYSTNDANSYNTSSTKYFSTVNSTNRLDSTILINQYNKTTSSGNGYGMRLSYTEPLNQYSSFELNYSYNLNKSNSDKKTFDFDAATQNWDVLNNRYTNHYESTFTDQRVGLSIQTRKNKFDYTFGLGLEPTSIKGQMLLKDTMRYTKLDVMNFSPMASFNYTFDKNTRFSMQYRGQANQPDISQLQPIEDNSNPLLITKGNPNLKPEFSNSINMNFNSMNFKNYANYFMNAQIGNTMNRITTMNTYGKGGVQTSTPVNVNGGFTSFVMLGMGRPFSQNKYVINTFGMFRYNQDISFASNAGGASGGSLLPPKNTTTAVTGMYNAMFTINWKKFTLITSGRVTYNNAQYTIQTIPNTEYTNYSGTMDARVTLPGSIRLASDISYTTNNGLSTGFNQNTTLWNGNIVKDFFKDKRAQIKIQVYDILGQNKSIRRNTTQNYIEDVQSKVLTRYLMVSFIYNFNKFMANQRQPVDDMRNGPPMRGMFHRD
ncbi:MAG: TonB-dependent receptor [Bacteroidetes bacterium]|nr:TonB-dependent receptor [Bacteroidota bacterium]